MLGNIPPLISEPSAIFIIVESNNSQVQISRFWAILCA